MNASRDGLFDWNLITNEIYYSPGWKKMLGYKDDELPNDFSIWEKLTKPEDIERSWKMQQELISKQRDRFEMEFKMKHKNGHWIDVLSRAEAVFNDKEKAIRIVGTHLDITNRKKAEKQLIQSKGNLKNTFDLSPSIIAKADMNIGRFTQVNKAITKLLGYTAEEFTSKPYMEFVHPNDRQSTIDIATEQLKGNEVTFFENRYLCKDGTYKWMAWHGTKPDENGVVTTIGSDIHVRKIIEQEIVKTKQLLEESQTITHVGGWELDILTSNLFWTAETYRIHDTSPEEFNPTLDAGVGYFLPKSRHIISEALKAAIECGEGYDLILETLTTKGRKIDVRTTCAVTLQEGRPVKLTGIFQDITKQKQIEKELITAKEKAETNNANISAIIEGTIDKYMGFRPEL